MCRDFVLTVSLSRIAKCLLLPKEGHLLAVYLLPVLVVVVLWLYCVLITVSWQCLSLKHFNSVLVSSQSNP